MAKIELDPELRKTINSWTQIFLVFIKDHGIKQIELAQALDLKTARTITEWKSTPSIAPDNEQNIKYNIPSKNHFISLALIRIQMEILQKDKSKSHSDLLKLSAIPILALGVRGITASSALGLAALVSSLNPLFGIIGGVLLAESVLNLLKENKKESLVDIVKELHECQKKNKTWEEILETIKANERIFTYKAQSQ